VLQSKMFFRLAATFLLTGVSCAQAAKAQDKSSVALPIGTSHIGIGDRIKIEVSRHPELSKTVVVDRKGNISLPSINPVKAVGLSPLDLAAVVRRKLEHTVPEPQVTVTMVSTSAPSPPPSSKSVQHPSYPPRDIPPPEPQQESPKT
jgi:protein involved in polysaccharide export with SLBB domain